jgi:hypothetical protein
MPGSVVLSRLEKEPIQCERPNAESRGAARRHVSPFLQTNGGLIIDKQLYEQQNT